MNSNFEANNFYRIDTLKRRYANKCFKDGISALAAGDLLLAGVNFSYASAFGVKKANEYLDRLYENPSYRNQISKFSWSPIC